MGNVINLNDHRPDNWRSLEVIRAMEGFRSVLRIEHRTTRNGPFHSSAMFDYDLFFEYIHVDCTIYAEMYFGCKDISQLVRYFRPHVIRDLAEQGYIIAEYWVAPDDLVICKRDTQVAFNRDDSMHVFDYDPLEVMAA